MKTNVHPGRRKGTAPTATAAAVAPDIGAALITAAQHMPATAAEAAATTREALADLAEIKTWAVTSDELYTAADETLTSIVQRKDAFAEREKSVTGPMNDALKMVRGCFKPGRDAFEEAEAHLKGQLSNYRVQREAAERAARDAAAKAATSGDAGALHDALAEAEAAAAAPEGRSTVGFGWEVERIAEDLLPDAYWTPDVKRIAAEAKAHKGDDPPVIPGVVFKRVAKIGARR